jgi:hypothetical protein
MEPLSPARPKNFDKRSPSLIDALARPTPKQYLVPCRWQKSGWKYVNVDPEKSKFFGSPNRIVNAGFSPKQK